MASLGKSLGLIGHNMNAEELSFRAGRIPWRWTKFAREAASLCKQEGDKFRVLQIEHHLTKLEVAELNRQRIADAEKFQTLRDDYQLLKHELEGMKKQRLVDAEFENKLQMTITALEEERRQLIEKNDQMKEGVSTLFEYIRRNKAKDDRGNKIPNLRVYPNLFRQ